MHPDQKPYSPGDLPLDGSMSSHGASRTRAASSESGMYELCEQTLYDFRKLLNVFFSKRTLANRQSMTETGAWSQ